MGDTVSRDEEAMDTRHRDHYSINPTTTDFSMDDGAAEVEEGFYGGTRCAACCHRPQPRLHGGMTRSYHAASFTGRCGPPPPRPRSPGMWAVATT